MELKISVKTILLFTALFILGTMILGFYSCSGNTTPVSPQLTDEFTDDGILDTVEGPVTIDNGDGTITIIGPDGEATTILNDGGSTTIDNEDGTITIVDANGDTTTVTTPGTTITTEDGTTITTYTATLDEEGNLIFVTSRDSAGISGASDGPGVDVDLITLEFSTFVQVGELWTGDVRVINNSNYYLYYPLIACSGSEALGEGPPQPNEFKSVDFLDTLVNPDIYFGFYEFVTLNHAETTPETAYPTIFIADEDEGFKVDPGEFAEHEITVRFDPAAPQYLGIYLAYRLTSTEIVPEGSVVPWFEIPLGIDIEFVEYLDEVSMIEITVDVGPVWAPEANPVLVEESLYGELYTFAFSGYNGFEQPVYTGSIVWNPGVDGPINVMAYFPRSSLISAYADSSMDFTTLSPE